MSAAVLVLLGDEDEAEFTNLDLIAGGEGLGVTGLAVDVGAVERAHVTHAEALVLAAGGQSAIGLVGDGDARVIRARGRLASLLF